MRVMGFILDLERRGFDMSKAKHRLGPDGGLTEWHPLPNVLIAPVEWSDRLKTTAGKAWSYRDSTFKIELARKMLLAPGDEGWECVKKTFLHELAHLLTPNHYAMHGAEWMGECLMVGYDRLDDYGLPAAKHLYPQMPHKARRELHVIAVCDDCGATFRGRKSLSKNHRYGCGRCDTPNPIRKVRW